MNLYTSPSLVPLDSPRPWIFLAGSIEQDTAADWQTEVVKAFADVPCTLINPRRAEWDPTWTHDNPQFKAQVNWELDYLDIVDMTLMYFDPQTKSPITLLELGLYARTGKLYVSCTPEFWRFGNVEIVCQRNGMHVHSSLQELIAAAKPVAQAWSMGWLA